MTGEEAKYEKAALHARWRLINEDNISRKDIVYSHGQLVVKGVLHMAAPSSTNQSYTKSNANSSVPNTKPEVISSGGAETCQPYSTTTDNSKNETA